MMMIFSKTVVNTEWCNSRSLAVTLNMRDIKHALLYFHLCCISIYICVSIVLILFFVCIAFVLYLFCICIVLVLYWFVFILYLFCVCLVFVLHLLCITLATEMQSFSWCKNVSVESKRQKQQRMQLCKQSGQWLLKMKKKEKNKILVGGCWWAWSLIGETGSWLQGHRIASPVVSPDLVVATGDLFLTSSLF